MREIVLDTETTGLDAREDRIVEVACIELHERAFRGKTFQRYVNPEREIPQEAVAIHGITNDRLRDKPKFAEIADEFLQFIGDDPLVIHNAGFDLRFLNEELARIGRPALPRERCVDTLEIARRKFPGAQNNLDRLAERFGIDASARTLHGGLVDADILLEVYLELTDSRRQDLGIDALLVETVEDDPGPARQRPEPMGPLSTAEERAAHRAFVREALGEGAIWLRHEESAAAPSTG